MTMTWRPNQQHTVVMKALIQATRTVLLAIAILTACWCRAGEKDQILFLHLKLKDDAITLVGSSVKPGRLKTPFAPDKKGQVHLELTSTNGTVLWSDVIADPTVQRLEYKDPDHPGALKTKQVKVAETEFTLRLPFHKDAKQLKLHSLEKPANRADAVKRTKKLLGSVAIPPTEAAP